MTSQYAYGKGSAFQITALEEYCDPITLSHLAQLPGEDIKEVWEVGAGGGSIARALAATLGAKASVIATDINIDYLTDMPGVDVRKHDVRTDPAPGKAFDLIHDRNVTLHLDERLAVLDTYVSALAPGGYLLLESFNSLNRPTPITSATPEDAELFTAFLQANWRAVAKHGARRTWASELPAVMESAGLQIVSAYERRERCTAGGPCHRIHQANIERLRPHLLESVAGSDLDRLHRLLGEDPRLTTWGHPLTTVLGRKLPSSAS